MYSHKVRPVMVTNYDVSRALYDLSNDLGVVIVALVGTGKTHQMIGRWADEPWKSLIANGNKD